MITLRGAAPHTTFLTVTVQIIYQRWWFVANPSCWKTNSRSTEPIRQKGVNRIIPSLHDWQGTVDRNKTSRSRFNIAAALWISIFRAIAVDFNLSAPLRKLIDFWKFRWQRWLAWQKSHPRALSVFWLQTLNKHLLQKPTENANPKLYELFRLQRHPNRAESESPLLCERKRLRVFNFKARHFLSSICQLYTDLSTPNCCWGENWKQ